MPKIANNPIKGRKMRFNENTKVKTYFKSGNTTTLFCKGMTQLASMSLAMYIERFCKSHDSALEGHFIFSNHG